MTRPLEPTRVFHPIRRLAIVNRGEAAMRCIRAVKALRTLEGSDIKAIALYTDLDRDAPFVRHADLAVRLAAPRGAVAAYLDHEALFEALRAMGADAVWPGWGFVAEDARFSERLRDEGIAFLGPPPEAMRAVGDKIASKGLAEKAQVPVSDWNGGVLDDAAAASEAAARIGYPVVLKASAGGGGRGIRVVHSPQEVEDAYRSAHSEASAAFGDGRMFCEKLVSGGRHIEVQIAADAHGCVRAVGSRDCSVQRRHQKVLEEAPPPGMSGRLRGEIEQAAVRIARAVHYEGVGTVEFLVAGDRFVFLEVNPRLQVEHGITEELSGIDLVQLQIRIARGEPIDALEIHERGVAIEARVCAEDPDQGFIPSPGRIALFDPSVGAGVRIDTGVSVGTTVPPDFDSLLAKVIATGATRDEARARLTCALRDFELVVHGGATNKGYLLELLESDDHAAGAVDTTWLDRWSASRTAAGADDGYALVAAAILAYQRVRAEARLNFYSDPTSISAERVPPSKGQQLDLSYGSESYRLQVYAMGSWRYRVHLDGRAVTAEMREEGSHSARLVIDDLVHRVLYDATEMGLRVEIDGHPYRFGWQTLGQVRSSTPAMVVAVHVEPGDCVEAGQSLGILEAMKMEIGFEAPVSGTVSEVVVRKGQKVAAGEVLLVIEPAAEDSSESGAKARLGLPAQGDPLAVLFARVGERELGRPDLAAAASAEPAVLRGAMQTVRDEIRRVLLGYDANPDRGESLVAFLEAPLPEELPGELLGGLAALRREISVFADVERLFIRSPQASVSGQLGPSNNARLRVYLRRLHAQGSGIAAEFLDLLQRALRHYGVEGLETSDALERAVLRMLASQLAPELRRRLVQGLLHLLAELSARSDLSHDATLERSLDDIASMRGLVPDSLADAAIESQYGIFERARLERRIQPSSHELEGWLADSENSPTLPDDAVLHELAVAPQAIYERVGVWLDSADPLRREIALAAHLQRRYAASGPLDRGVQAAEGTTVQWVVVPGRGKVLARIAGAKDLDASLRTLLEAARALRSRTGSEPVRPGLASGDQPGTDGDTLLALELLVPRVEACDSDAIADRVGELIANERPGCRVTVELRTDEGRSICHTFAAENRDASLALDSRLHTVHPEVAARIDLIRYAGFDLERIPAEPGVYAFYGRSREVPGDERVFVLADVTDRFPQAPLDLEPHVAAFERAFHRATSHLRSILQLRDPRRRLQWNRIGLFVAVPAQLDRETAARLARRLAPGTRHLGLEKLLVRLDLIGADDEESRSPLPVEIVFTDPTGQQMEINWREPHRDRLYPAQDYERRMVEARRRRLVYPYEIVRMLTHEDRVRTPSMSSDSDLHVTLPSGSFEEFDIASPGGRAVSVAGREYGSNAAAVVFGVISTPTEKVPEGVQRVLVLSDPTMGMGALSAPECDRIIAAIDLAEQRGLPVEWVPVSSGAKIAMDSGTENLDATARVVRRIVNFTQSGGEINVIVQGVNVGAQSYFDALSTMLMHTRGVLLMTPGASMVLTGRAALEASGAVSAEDEVAIGGYERVMGPNGEAQYYARNLAEAYRTLYSHYEVSYVVPGEKRPRRAETADSPLRNVCDSALSADGSFDFETVGEIFDDAHNPGRKRAFPMRAVMTALVDQDLGHLERWHGMTGGETAIVWDAHLGGEPITLIGVESHNLERDGYRPLDGPESWSGGTLFPHSSKKVARAINSASGNRPVVVLANLSGFDGSPESLRKLQLEYGAEIARAVVNFHGPLLFLVVSRYHGGAYVVFSQELNDGLRASALSGSYASVIGGGPAASVVFGRDVRAQAIADDRVREARQRLRHRPDSEARETFDRVLGEVMLEKQAELAAEFDAIHSVERAREVGSLREIFDPAEMRGQLIAQLEEALR